MAGFVDGEEAERIDEYRQMLPRRPIGLDDLPDNIRSRFLGLEAGDGNLVFVLHDVRLSDTARAAELVADTRTIRAGGQSWQGASEATVINDLLRVMKEDSAVAIPLAMLGAFLVLALDMRSARRAMVPLLPLVVGLCWLAAVMWLTGFRLNLYNMVMLPAMVGIGVDSGIHLYHRFLEDVAGNRPDGGREQLDSTNGAVAMSAVTTMVAFGSMSLSAHGGLASLGWLALLGLGAVLLSATTVFSLLLLHRPDWFV
jgi:predicted exporter